MDDLPIPVSVAPAQPTHRQTDWRAHDNQTRRGPKLRQQLETSADRKPRAPVTEEGE